MTHSRFKTRIRKLVVSMSSPICWQGLSRRVFPAIEHIPLLRSLHPDAVLDVGANKGQFALAVRMAISEIPIISFEPIPSEAKRFREVHGSCKRVSIFEVALGDSVGKAQLHVSQSADNSSLLPVSDRQTKLVPSSQEVAQIEVSVQPLDSFKEHWSGCNQLLLKIDVQGFELNVLRGAVETLALCSYVYVECSEVVLYEGQALHSDVTEFLSGFGFIETQAIDPICEDGKLLQANYLYVRK